MRVQFIGAFTVIAFTLSVLAESKNETVVVVTDPFEDDFDLRYAADQFCREVTMANPAGKVAIPYKPSCQQWWQCNAYELKKHECQGKSNGILLHYDLYLDRCEMPGTVKCNYVFDELEIIMDRIMDYYVKTPDRNPDS